MSTVWKKVGQPWCGGGPVWGGAGPAARGRGRRPGTPPRHVAVVHSRRRLFGSHHHHYHHHQKTIMQWYLQVSSASFSHTLGPRRVLSSTWSSGSHFLLLVVFTKQSTNHSAGKKNKFLTEKLFSSRKHGRLFLCLFPLRSLPSLTKERRLFLCSVALGGVSPLTHPPLTRSAALIVGTSGGDVGHARAVFGAAVVDVLVLGKVLRAAVGGRVAAGGAGRPSGPGPAGG